MGSGDDRHNSQDALFEACTYSFHLVSLQYVSIDIMSLGRGTYQSSIIQIEVSGAIIDSQSVAMGIEGLT